MWQVKLWWRMVAWALVGVLVVGLWATPGWAKKKLEKPKPIDGEIAGLLVAIEDEWPGVKGLVFWRLAEFDGQAAGEPEAASEKKHLFS
jgi:hypothetical protein